MEESAYLERSTDLEEQIQFAGSGRAKDGYGISPLEFGSKEEQMAFYDGHDVDDPQGLLSWQNNLIQEICPKRTISISVDQLPSNSTATAEEGKHSRMPNNRRIIRPKLKFNQR
ncbi:hypothetical protein N7489_008517 [Penicillium chrysogenum]|uniref:uncharacterized protein n=1 Tax=Penicillium chrysogenum TaxID=5076 RepID=UPI0023A5B384|nr:uncharacterized protein N7489_008517 [Penicillium chrysogenum]KAJ5227809.1 hypothetical protein N7489_008517 [Penicillium chrysogenum]KAJ5286465.1 hypothetical protein N7524_001771 [Penicillium chrysogenum]